MLHNLLENDSVLNNNLNYAQNKLHCEGSSTYSFPQYDRKSPSPKVPVVGQILEKVMQKNHHFIFHVNTYFSAILFSIYSTLFIKIEIVNSQLEEPAKDGSFEGASRKDRCKKGRLFLDVKKF